MKTDKSYYFLVWIVLFLFNCKSDKTDPECKDASCCHPEYNKYEEYVQDIKVELSGPPQFSNWALRSTIAYPTDPNNPYKSKIFDICSNSLDKIQGFIPDFEPTDTTKIKYNFQVSGKILTDVKNPRLTAIPVLSISIDKIKRIEE